MKGCIPCAQGFDEECPDNGHPEFMPFADGFIAKYANHSGNAQGRPLLPDSEVIDARSTMRKRAQKVYAEANPHMVKGESRCQWQGLRNCGLERHPITGCKNGIFSHVHHLTKDIYDNRPTNLVGICTRCHNLTHSFIDFCVKRDSQGSETLLHALATKASEDELEIWNNPEKKHLIPRANHTDCTILETRPEV